MDNEEWPTYAEMRELLIECEDYFAPEWDGGYFKGMVIALENMRNHKTTWIGETENALRVNIDRFLMDYRCVT